MQRGTGDRGVADGRVAAVARGLETAYATLPSAATWMPFPVPGLGPGILAPITRNAGAFGGGLVGGAFGGMIPDTASEAFAQMGGTAYLGTGAFLVHHPLIFLDGCWDGVWEELQGWWELAWSLLSLEAWTKLIGQLTEAARVLFSDAATAFYFGWSMGETMTESVTGVLQGDGETIAYETGVLLGPILLELAGTLLLGLGLAKMGVRTATGAGAKMIDTLVDVVRRGRLPSETHLPTGPVPGVTPRRGGPGAGGSPAARETPAARGTADRGLDPTAENAATRERGDGPGEALDAPGPSASDLRAAAAAAPSRFAAGLVLDSARVGFDKLKTAMKVAPRVRVEVVASGRSYFGRDAVKLRFRLDGRDFSMTREADLIEARYDVFQEQIDRFIEDFEVPPRPLPSADIPRTRSKQYDYQKLPGTAVDEAKPRMFEGYQSVGRDRSPRGDRPLKDPDNAYWVQEEEQMRLPSYLNSIFGHMDTRGRDLMVKHPDLDGYGTLLDEVELVWDGGRPTRDPSP